MLEWYHIPHYESLYKINLLGQVKNIHNNALLTPQYKCGYSYVSLSRNGHSKSIAVHYLLAKTFLPNPENKKFIDHINGDKNDNRLENLRWATEKENVNNPNTHHKMSSNIKKGWHTGRKYNYDKLCKPVLCVETGIIYSSQTEAGKILGIRGTKISAACRGRRTIAGGFHWRKIEDLTPQERINFNIESCC